MDYNNDDSDSFGDFQSFSAKGLINFLPKNPNDLCNRLRLFLQEKNLQLLQVDFKMKFAQKMINFGIQK